MTTNVEQSFPCSRSTVALLYIGCFHLTDIILLEADHQTQFSCSTPSRFFVRWIASDIKGEWSEMYSASLMKREIQKPYSPKIHWFCRTTASARKTVIEAIRQILHFTVIRSVGRLVSIEWVCNNTIAESVISPSLISTYETWYDKTSLLWDFPIYIAHFYSWTKLSRWNFHNLYTHFKNFYLNQGSGIICKRKKLFVQM